MSNNKKVSSGLQGISRLVTDAIIGVTNIVEAMHRRVVHPPYIPSTSIQHLVTDIAGITYNNIRSSTHLIGSAVDKALAQFANVLGDVKVSEEKEVLRSVLNGVIGDYLEEQDNPLQITMQFRHEAKAIPLDTLNIKKAYPAITGKILLMVHGSCMNDIQWTHQEHNHGLEISKELNQTPIYLHYNSGRHISTNGQEFNTLLERLIMHWPVPIEQLSILAHSMGGLVARSALHYGMKEQSNWAKHLNKIIFLGTPHHGAPLEKAGNYLDVILESIPYAKPFARLGKIRSAGITDLRHGNLVDEDWMDDDRFENQIDVRLNIPLPKEVECYSIAGISKKNIDSKAARLVGDKMVSLKSALGQHQSPAKDLNFEESNTWIAAETTHSDLLSNSEVYEKIKEWLILNK